MADLLPDLQAALGGAYRFEKELGGGGMSRVYLAEELGLGRHVVVKVLPPELGAGVNVDRFRRETQLAASLQHPHIVPLLTAGAAGELLYYTMPFVEGESLRTRLARESELPVRDAVRILHDVADALAYAHGRGVIHRDIKPDNVLLSGGHAQVTDFGIAKALSQAAGSSGLTSVGVAIGTPTYMAPEQAAGDPNVDHRADIYSLGAMAYEMLGGRPPFSGMSPHQMLAAHVTEQVEDIRKHRAHLPSDLADLVMWCLQKNPPDRPQTAAELVTALEGIATPTGGGSTASVRFGGGRRRSVPWTRIALGAGAVAILAGGWIALRSRQSAALDADRVAVAPFDVLDPALTLWREGLVDVLSRSLDGAGPLRTVSPTLVVKRWSGRADPASAQALGQATGAGTVVYGQMIGAGDSVKLTATVLDAASGRGLGDIELHDAAARVDRLADSLTVAVLRTLGRTRAIGAVRGTPLGSTSLPALKAFLQGEQFLRRSQYDSALAYDQRAIALDSTFTLALSHASMAAGWQHSGGDSLTVAYALAAGRLNHGLAPRESLVVVADSLMAVVFAGPQAVGGAWWTYGKRLLATLDEAVRRYPSDPELWYTLGDARFHAGMAGGLTRAQALDAFDHSIALDSSFSPAYIHAVGLALQAHGTEAARRYTGGFLKASREGRYAQLYGLFDRLVDPHEANSEATARTLDSLAPQLPFMISGVFDRWPDSAETQIRLARTFETYRLRRAATPADSLQAHAPLAQALAYRGHLQEAYRTVGTRAPVLYPQFALLGAVPAESADAVMRGWTQTPNQGLLWALAWWSARRDTAMLQGAVRQLEAVRGHLPAAAPPIAKDIVGYMIASASAHLALARGDSAAAVQKFATLPDTACFGLCPLDELVRVQLLEARGRPQDALSWLDRRSGGAFLPALPSDMLQMLVRGRLNERLGHRDEAIAAYTTVSATWARADATLKPYVDEARAGLARLSREAKP
jgi:tRNA A-37 threonylcarbamoyl transferase component Bud32/TolB-like protein